MIVRLILTLALWVSTASLGNEKSDIHPEDINLLISIAMDASPTVNDNELLQQPKKAFPIKIDLFAKSIIQDRIRLFKKRGISRIKFYVERGKTYIPIIKEIFDRYDIPDELVFLPLIESHFDIKARSSAGAAGLWQFMPQTARMYGLTINKWIDERYDVYKSTEAAALYLKDLYGIFEDWSLALASYNTGEGVIIRKINKYGGLNFWDIDEYLSKETRNYVPNFLASVAVVREILENEHFSYSDKKLEVLSVNKPISLVYISSLTGISVKTLKELNPHLKKGITPPMQGTYNIYLPRGYRDLVESALEKAPLKSFVTLETYIVREGDTLSKIARRFNTSVNYLKNINKLKETALKAGTVMKVPSFIKAYPMYYKGILEISEDVVYTSKGVVYVVKKGDTLSKIARKFNVPLRTLKKWNKVKDYIYPGQKIVIYKKVKLSQQSNVKKRNISALKRLVKKRKPSRKYIYYNVRKGDSLIKIAKRFRVSVKQIREWNNIKNDRIRIGQKITILKRVNDG